MNTMALEHFKMAVYLNGKWVALDDILCYQSIMDALCSLCTALSALGVQDAPAIITINHEHKFRTTISKANEVVDEWCDEHHPTLEHNYVYLTEEKWEQKFKPLVTYDTLPDNVPEHHLWTLIQSYDGGLAYANGIHFVDALTYCECEVPWRDGEEYSVELDTEGLED